MARLVRIGDWGDEIGYWRDEAPNYPDPQDFVDATWDETDRQRVVRYLRSATAPWVSAGVPICRICEAALDSAELTDGTYLWPAGLAHYVEEHRVRLPEPVLGHIRQRWDKVLDQLEVDADWGDVDVEWWLAATTRT